MTAVLTQFRPPTAKIRLRNATLRGEYLKNAGSIEQSFRGYEIFSVSVAELGVPKEEPKFTIVEDYPTEVSPDQLAALGDLITGRWRDIFRISRTELVFDGTYKKHSLRLFSLTETNKSNLQMGIDVLAKNKRFRIALERWYTGLRRDNPLDTVLDLCSSLEACFGLGSELRLRLSFAVRSVLHQKKKRAARVVYDMYGVRNDFIHGSKIPTVTAEREFDFVEVASTILKHVASHGKIPSTDDVNSEIFGN